MGLSVEEQLKALILGKYKSIRAFATMIGMPQSTVDSILSRGIAKANITNVISICKELGIDVNELVRGRVVPVTGIRSEEPVTTEDQELWELRQQMKDRPEMKILFSLTKNATKEDVMIVNDLLKKLKDREMGDFEE